MPGHAITVDGTRISLASGGGDVVIGTTTIDLDSGSTTRGMNFTYGGTGEFSVARRIRSVGNWLFFTIFWVIIFT